MKKQTAVEWLQEQFRAFGTITDSHDERTHQLIKTAINMCEQAKAMEREQMMKLISFVRMHNKMGKSANDLLQEFETYKGGEQ